MKRRILFVDDEPNILQALQRMLRPMRQEWEMEFAENAVQALARLKQQPFDVLVSDVRMPGMDGVALLKEVRKQYPQTVRLLLSGQADKEKLMQAVGPAHQFLAKPCDAEKLKISVYRCCHLTDTIFNQQIKTLVTQIECLPVLPMLYQKLIEELEHKEPSLERIGKLIESDIGMSVKILNIVNSAYFGLSKTLTSASQAVAYLGLNIIRDLVLVVKLFEQFEGTAIANVNFDRLWQHCLSVGICAKQIVQLEGGAESEANAAFTGGMLHDLGIIILASQMPGQFQQIIEQERENHSPIYNLEQDLFGISHAELGAHLLEIWGLPLNLVETVGFHHQPAKSAIREFHPLIAVHVAHGLTDSGFRGHRQSTTDIDEEYIAQIGLGDRLAEWKDLNTVTAGQE